MASTTNRKAAVLILAAMIPACSSLQRSDKATNVEDARELVGDSSKDDARPAPQAPAPRAYATTTSQPLDDDAGPAPAPPDFAPAPQKIAGAPKAQNLSESAPNPLLAEAHALYQKALKAQHEAAYVEATALWRDFVDRFTGMPSYEKGQFNLALCQLHLGQAAESTQALKDLIPVTNDARLANDARILLAEALIHLGQTEEALALTFEVLPDQEAEKKAGLHRSRHASAGPGRPTAVQMIRLLTLRGRIYASKQDDVRANYALRQARELIDQAEELTPDIKKLLIGHLAWRQLEAKSITCNRRVTPPARLSEAEFLAYVDAYYGCATPARSLFCEVLAANDQQIRSLALATYRGLVEAPLELRDHLPPPARPVKKKEQRPHYESEMKALIEKTVASRAKQYRDLPSCNAFDLF
jgi:TolA-binding protein